METTPEEQPQPQPEPGPELWVREAIAEQEEYIKRWRGCGGKPIRHTFGPFGAPAQDGAIESAATWSACIVCGVTQTRADYRVRSAARSRNGQDPLP